MEVAEPIKAETLDPNQDDIKIDFIEEKIIKKENEKYKIQFGIKEKNNELVIRVADETFKDLYYFQKSFPKKKLDDICEVFCMYKNIKDIIIKFLKNLEYEIEKKEDFLIIKFTAFMPDGHNKKPIEINLKKTIQDLNHIINYFLEVNKSMKNDVNTSEERIKQGIKKHKEKIEQDLKGMKDNIKDEIKKSEESIENCMKKSEKNTNDEISGLKTADQKHQTKIEDLNKTIESQNLCINICMSIIFFSIIVIYILWPKKDIENEISNLTKENDRGISNLKEEIYFLYSEIFQYLTKLKLDSKIIDSLNSIMFLLAYIRRNDNSFKFNYLKLLYRGSRDGDRTKTCHKLCDNKQNVLIIMKSDTDYIFGGYSKIGFKTNNEKDEYKIDNNCFLFSFNLTKIYPAKVNEFSILYTTDSKGLSFFVSLYFYDNFMNSEGGRLGTYIKSQFTGLSDEYEMNGGKRFFTFKELEVFQLL